MSNLVQKHYQRHPYPQYPLIASVRLGDTYALNLNALWCRFNGVLPPATAKKILIAGSGAFAPYPCSVANPDAKITALDLSERSLRRARLHCLLHGRRNIDFQCGDLLDSVAASGKFGLIDSYGVLHHLDDPLSGLKSLEARLLEGGILRIMVYSRYARREEESIRRAMRLLGINTPAQVRRLLAKARVGSRLADYVAASDETDSDAGIADALLHPLVHTFRIDGLLDMIRQTGLEPLLFAHQNARDDVQEEIGKLRELEKERLSPGNFVLYLGKNILDSRESSEENLIMLNPCLRNAVSPFTLGAVHIPARIGIENPVLGRSERRLLRRFVTPVRRGELARDLTETVDIYKRALFLMEYSA
jgi:SAM-dependent methyltransferase